MSTDSISIHFAQGFRDERLKPFTIKLDEEIETLDTILANDRQYETEGELLERVLHEHLPGGTYDRLLSRMLARRASHFVVPLG